MKRLISAKLTLFIFLCISQCSHCSEQSLQQVAEQQKSIVSSITSSVTSSFRELSNKNKIIFVGCAGAAITYGAYKVKNYVVKTYEAWDKKKQNAKLNKTLGEADKKTEELVEGSKKLSGVVDEVKQSIENNIDHLNNDNKKSEEQQKSMENISQNLDTTKDLLKEAYEKDYELVNMRNNFSLQSNNTGNDISDYSEQKNTNDQNKSILFENDEKQNLNHISSTIDTNKNVMQILQEIEDKIGQIKKLIGEENKKRDKDDEDKT